jgi:hypothetical protein
VTKTRSFHTIGALTPAPGTRAFQSTLLVLDQRTGSVFSCETPVPAGPRQAGQLSARAARGQSTRHQRARERIGEISSLLDREFT